MEQQKADDIKAKAAAKTKKEKENKAPKAAQDKFKDNSKIHFPPTPCRTATYTSLAKVGKTMVLGQN